ncbi:MAG: DUF294 nucleotidyltransferase-like domain-containing protein [Gammaproteobacteria bacterium]|nr:DUF294 nucleotidyltransferase-like domain-containing protein [Gammaproteobacteria bacterium]MDH5593583.1 DUF294 nucleotidyltransferase-like domain-containing protein [Gammaproteobacteria bacterium]
MLPPPSHTPLIALPVLVLDLETTGLDVKNDRVIQIGATGMQGDTIIGQPQLNHLLNPGMPIPATSSAIHKIFDQDVVDAPRFIEVAEHLKTAMAGRVVVGQHIAFDIAILRHEFARNGLVWHEPTILDVSQLVGALKPTLPELSLESVTDFLGVVIQDRHTAMGDCLAAAQSWIKLIALLRERDIRTLGEALTLSNQRQDLILQQIQSGWLSPPDGLVSSTLTATSRIDSYVFEHRLADVMTQPPKILESGASLRTAAKTMMKNRIGCLLISDEGTKQKGIITENDLLRVMADARFDLDNTPASQIMSTPVQCMHQNEILYRALARMDRLSVSHLCVVDDNSLPVGVISQRDLLRYRARGPHMLSDALQVAHDTATLADAYARVTSIAARLVTEDLDGTDVARVIASELQALTGRATQLCMERMEAEGKDKPPADWCVMVLGSGGRAESLLSADQDNALIHTGTKEDDDWFAQFGTYLAEMLDGAGLPLCTGNVMVSSRQWRGSVEEWQERVGNWVSRAHPEDLLSVDIFFDMVPVAGSAELARQLHQQAIALAAKSHAFTNLLAHSVQSVAPRFSLFGRLKLSEGRLDLKRDGLLPLVSFARTLAIRIGSVSRATPERLRDVLASGRLSEGDTARLIELHKELLSLILKQQIQDINEGLPVNSSVEIKQFSRRQYSRLLHELRHLDTMVGQIQSLISN